MSTTSCIVQNNDEGLPLGTKVQQGELLTQVASHQYECKYSVEVYPDSKNFVTYLIYEPGIYELKVEGLGLFSWHCATVSFRVCHHVGHGAGGSDMEMEEQNFHFILGKKQLQIPFVISHECSKIHLNIEYVLQYKMELTFIKLCEHFHPPLEKHPVWIKELQKSQNQEKVDQIQGSIDPSSIQFIHFFVFVHGNHGYRTDFHYFGEYLRNLITKKSSYSSRSKVFILYSSSNEGFNTHAGIDVCSKRLSDEIIQYYRKVIKPFAKHCMRIGENDDDCKSNNPMILFSLIGHSLGGLFCRHVLSHIFSEKEFNESVIPCSYMSINTPHLGVKKPSNQNFFLSNIAKTYCKLLGKTGTQLYIDHNSEIPDVSNVQSNSMVQSNETKSLANPQSDSAICLLEMSIPDSIYMKQLERFKTKTLVSSVHMDRIVPFPSSAILHENPYKKLPIQAPTSIMALYYQGFEDFKSHLSHVFVPSKQEYCHDVKFIEEKRLKCLGETKTKESATTTSNNSKTSEFIGPKLNSITDNFEEIEFLDGILSDLQKIDWRRINFEFQFESNHQEIFSWAHNITINKPPKLSGITPPKDHPVGVKCCTLIASVVAMDHEEAIHQSLDKSK